MYNRDADVPARCVMTQVTDETPEVRRLTLKFVEGASHGGFSENDFEPGQFVLLGLTGVDEMPVCMCSSPTDAGRLELCVRRTDSSGSALDALAVGDEAGLRGPFGVGFPLGELRGQDLLFVAGGVGLAPLRSLIRYVFAMRGDFGQVTILVGAPTPETLIFRDELNSWQRQPGTEVLLTVERASATWSGSVGVVTELLDDVAEAVPSRLAVVSGSPAMMRAVGSRLLDHGMNPENIIMTLERHMACGVGSCGTCDVGGKRVCLDGPVFCFRELEDLGAYEFG